MAAQNACRRTRIQRVSKNTAANSNRCNASTHAHSATKRLYCDPSAKICLPTVNQVCINLDTCCDAPPCTAQGQALLALWNQICPNFDPDYIPPEPEPYTPICVDCLPANPELLVIFEQIADILEL